MSKGLTGKQRAVMGFVESHIRERGYPPTVREIGERMGFSWPAARAHLRALAKKGFVRLSPFKSRGIGLARGGPQADIDLPLVGAVRAGRPLFAVQDIEARVAVDRGLFRDPDAFVLRVTGDSMKEAGILEGDYVVVSPGREVMDGQVGVALIGEEATVKKIYREGPVVRLVPCNREMEPSVHPAGEVVVVGRVAGVIRKL